MKEINGKMFKQMVLSGAIVLHNNHPEVDALNVFPVPDGDTGTNMSLNPILGLNRLKSLLMIHLLVISLKLFLKAY